MRNVRAMLQEEPKPWRNWFCLICEVFVLYSMMRSVSAGLVSDAKKISGSRITDDAWNTGIRKKQDGRQNKAVIKCGKKRECKNTEPCK